MFSRNRTLSVLIALVMIALSTSPAGAAGRSVFTRQIDNSRTGANLSETLLNPTTVASSAFSKLWSYTVSGSVLAQPLYVQYVAVPGHGMRNVLYVVTMNDMVYAFDADSNTLLWSVD